jgi:hypothetical protein
MPPTIEETLQTREKQERLKALDAAVACSRGETGWWGEGAKQP